MNNVTLISGMDELVSRWDDLIDRLTTLQGLVAGPLVGDIATWIGLAQPQQDAVDQARVNFDNAADIDANLLVARPEFEDSRDTLNAFAPAARAALNALQAANTGAAVKGAVAATRDAVALLEQVIGDFLNQATTIATDTGGRANIAGLRSTVDDISTFPVLTQELGHGGPTSYFPSGGGGGGGTATLGQVVHRAITDVLGRRPRLADTKSFVAALNNSFAVSEHEGHTIVTWNQRAGSGVSELGAAVTGAQASLYQRASGTLEDILPVVDSLTPLIPDADEELMQASRAIVRNQVSELVRELGVEGGPRVQRVNDLFTMLLDAGFQVEDNGVGVDITGAPDLHRELGAGEIGHLGYVFGLTSDHVNTIAEEQNLTQFILLRDHVQGLRDSWATFEAGFVGQAQTFLGTQLVHVTRSLGVIAESVDEATFAMDSVFFGKSERDTTYIEFPAPPPGVNGQNRPPRMFVSELLGWVRDFATVEGPRLIQDGGKIGARGCVPTLRRLHSLVNEAPRGIRHPAARHPRVRHAIEQLAAQTDQARRLVESIR